MRPTPLRLGAVVLLVLGVLTTWPANAVTSAAAPSSGFDDWSCRPSAEHPRPVVMLHGLSSNAQQWLIHGPAVAKAGYCVFTLNFGANANKVNGNAPVAQSGEEIGRFVDKVLAETDADKVDLVGHSARAPASRPLE